MEMSDCKAPDWMGLLQWSLKYQDGTVPSQHTPLTIEKRQFLANVFEDMVVNEPERLHVIGNKLIQYIGEQKLKVDSNLQHVLDAAASSTIVTNPVTTDDLEDLLDECEDIVQQIDMAGVFVKKYRGLDSLFIILLNKRDQTQIVNYHIRSRIAGIIALLAQNNEQVLAIMYNSSISIEGWESKSGVLDFLLHLYMDTAAVSHDTEAMNENKLKLCSKYIYILSALLSYVPFQRLLFELTNKTNGSLLLTEMLQHGLKCGYLPLVKRCVSLADTLVGKFLSNKEIASLQFHSSDDKSVAITTDAASSSTALVDVTSVSELTNAITRENIAQISAILVPIALTYLNYSIIESSEVSEEVQRYRVDVCESSLQYLLALSSSSDLVHLLLNTGTSSSSVSDTGATSFTSVITDYLFDSLKQHQHAIVLSSQPNKEYLNADQLQSEVAIIKQILQHILSKK